MTSRRSGRSWLAPSVAMVALATAAAMWVVGHRDEVAMPATLAVAASPMPPSSDLSLPSPSPSTAPSQHAPLPEVPRDAVQRLAPTHSARDEVRTPRTWSVPKDFVTLDLTLLQPCGAPAVGIELFVAAPDVLWLPDPRPSFSNDAGRVHLEQIPADTTLRVWGYDRQSSFVLSAFVHGLEPGKQHELSLTSSRNVCAVVVRVQDSGGRPLSGVTTRLTSSRTEALMIRTNLPGDVLTDADGVARFAGVTAGMVSVIAWLDGFAPVVLGDVPVDCDPLSLDVTIDTTVPEPLGSADDGR